MDAIYEYLSTISSDQSVFQNVNYCIIEEIFPCVACGDSFQCVFDYCTLFLCSFDNDRHAESRFDSVDFRLQSHFTTQIIVKGTLIGGNDKFKAVS